MGWTFRLNNNVDWTISFLGLVNQALGIPTSSLSLQGGVVDLISPFVGHQVEELSEVHSDAGFAAAVHVDHRLAQANLATTNNRLPQCTYA